MKGVGQFNVWFNSGRKKNSLQNSKRVEFGEFDFDIVKKRGLVYVLVST